MILIIKHVDVEGPGTIEEYFQNQGFELKTIELDKDDPLPRDFNGIEAVISMGGPMNVYEEDKYPFLRDEDFLLKRAIKEEIPFLGVCLGSQLIVKAYGAKVTKSPVKEVGWFKVRLENDGQQDPLFQGLDGEIDVFHWHEDMFEIPSSAKRLATADGCPNQAVKIGPCAYGLQFHVEVTEPIITDWCENYLKSSDPALVQKAKDMIATYQKKRAFFNKTAEKIYGNFEKIMESHKATRSHERR